MTGLQTQKPVYPWWSPDGVNMVPVTTTNPLPVQGSISATNPSVGANGSTAPTSSTEIGYINSGGNLTGVSSTNPLPISGTITAAFSEPVLNVVGSASSAAVLSNFPVTSTQGYRTAAVQVTSIAATSTLVAEESNDGTTWTGIQIPTDTVVEISTPMTSTGRYLFPVSMLQFRVRQSIYGGSGTSSVNVELRQLQIDTPQQAVSALQAGTWTVQPGNTANTTPWLSTINQGGNSATVTASNALKVDGSAVTQPISGTITANAGTGTFNIQSNASVNLNQVAGSAVDTGHGTAAGAIRVELPTDGTGVVTTNQGTANSIANSWPTEITDGTHGPVAVKAASTAPVATDPSIVVAFSPNGSLPTGSNTIGAVTQASGPWATNVTQYGSTNVVTGGVNGSVGVGGLAASGASPSGNPLNNGVLAATSNPTAVSNAQVISAMGDKVGRYVIVSNAPRALKTTTVVSTTDASSHTLIAAAGANVFTDILSILITNTSSTAVNITIGDGTNNHVIEAPANDTRGISTTDGLLGTSSNTAWTIQSSGAVSTIYCSVTYVKNI